MLCPQARMGFALCPNEGSDSGVISESVEGSDGGMLQLWFGSTPQPLGLVWSVIFHVFCKICRLGPTGEKPRLSGHFETSWLPSPESHQPWSHFQHKSDVGWGVRARTISCRQQQAHAVLVRAQHPSSSHLPHRQIADTSYSGYAAVG